MSQRAAFKNNWLLYVDLHIGFTFRYVISSMWMYFVFISTFGLLRAHFEEAHL